MCLIKAERCSSDGLLIFYGIVNVVELDRKLRNIFILYCFTMGGPLCGITPHTGSLYTTDYVFKDIFLIKIRQILD